MSRRFYLVDIEVMKKFEWIPLVNLPYSGYDFGLLFEESFWYDLRFRQGLFKEENNDKTLWSISADKKSIFEESCKELNIKVYEIDLEKLYNKYVQQNTIYNPSPQAEISKEDQIDICSQSFDHIICGAGTSQILLEHTIVEKDNIRLYINSNENARHNLPHCHVHYNSRTNYCVLSLVDYQKLAPDNNVKNAIICKAQRILSKHIQYARHLWNRIESPLKFKIVNGEYTNEYYMIKT